MDLLLCLSPPGNCIRESFKIFAEPPKQNMLKMLNVKNYLEISHIFHPSYDKQYEKKRERERKKVSITKSTLKS